MSRGRVLPSGGAHDTSPAGDDDRPFLLTRPVEGRHATGRRRAALSPDEQYCRDLTRREAANFYWGFIALPQPQRLAIYALYSFARQVDDDADLAGPDGRVAGSDARLGVPYDVRLRLQRGRVERCFAGRPDDPVMRVLARVVREYGIPRGELEALIDGVETDLRLSRYESWEQLRSYCGLVASSVGRMCVRIFGYTDPAALDFADDLGAAMQLANILRDVREDMGMGRIYLPQDELHRFGIGEQALLDGAPGPGWEALMRHEIERAQRLFASGLRVTAVIPRRAAVCVRTMAGIYQAIVEQIARDPSLPLSRRISLSGGEKLSVMARSWLRAR
jgi:15-cis-phytoene synthase